MPFTISSLVSYEEDIKKSRFQAFAVPVENEQAVKDFLEQYKDISTTHQCWAWKIGHNVRFNDDGEPSGTAGRPILATIEGNDPRRQPRLGFDALKRHNRPLRKTNQRGCLR